ncbi:hypothetical protein [Sulfurisphaera ohwakuensis]|uniref:Uncharacterized protein n=1 Tax=Sulfurisphaera ohwakuensis TaxID=69656 RepID=A0A650CGR6_SULOH|nr:hypothetical protein [Sulfurisphaera ohwakuensis]MBB5252622.1 hypothetical protein [Sulfurisphaera ohwakuensis]QGR16938.1 hypothetical protein D1869_06935 [Sulfurisphaera ohwakuensis]
MKFSRLIAGITGIAWSILHLTVGYNAATIAAHVVGNASFIFAIYSEYFGFNSALYLFEAYEILTYSKKLLPYFFLLDSWNTFLIIYTHLFPAPFLGKVLPIIPQVPIAIVFDVILLATILYLMVREK